MSSPFVPNSDELAELFNSSGETSATETNDTSFSDDLEALHTLEADSKRTKTEQGIVVQHRSWSTQEVFRSEPKDLSSSQAMGPFITSSPPPTPSPHKKRKFADIDLGQSQLTRPPKAQRVYYGINIHRLLEDAQAEDSIPKAAVELPTPPAEQVATKRSSLLWTEKYRARKFTDLIGDERTHRAVMHWLKRWDQIVFPGSYRPNPKTKGSNENEVEKPHRKILMLTGPPGLGKTTLAHVCAKQAGYEVQEINASDERSSNVVKGRIRDMVGTENVKSVDTKKNADGKVKKAGKPVCVVIDEVDGVVSGSGGSGEGGFVKALIDLIVLDQKNSTPLGTLQQAPARKKKGERFRLLRPMILICNDIYHPSLRPLRQNQHAEVIHVRKPPVQSLVSRLHSIFDREGVPCESDGVRRLCEATWGVSNRKEDRTGSGAGEGDMRGIMVVGEWVAGKLRSLNESNGDRKTLTRKWVEDHVLSDLRHGGGAARGLGRGGPRDIVERVFQEGAGFPKASAAPITPQHHFSSDSGRVKGVAEGNKRTATERLRELIETHGETDRIVTDCFSSYPEHPFQDDTLLSKPESAYEWLHFHDCLSSAVYSNNEWELAPYLSTPLLGFHHLFASPTRAQYIAPTEENGDATSAATHPFAGPQASWAAHEAQKSNAALLQNLQSTLSHSLARAFSKSADVSTDLLPYLLRMLTPSINPVVVGQGASSTASVRKASEQQLVARSVQAMCASGVRFERAKVGGEDNGVVAYGTQWVYRMEPSLDELAAFETGGKGFGESGGKVRFAIRQVLDQEWRKEEKRRAEVARLARFSGGGDVSVAGGLAARGEHGAAEARMRAVGPAAVKRDFFGRPIAEPKVGSAEAEEAKRKAKANKEQRVWVTYHEGFSNAVRKPITLAELMKDL